MNVWSMNQSIKKKKKKENPAVLWTDDVGKIFSYKKYASDTNWD